MTTHPTPASVTAVAASAGVELAPARPAQIAAALAPVMQAVARLEIPFEIEPASIHRLLASEPRR